MSKHLGKRERVARKSRISKRGGCLTVQDCHGSVTLQLGRKKFSEAIFGKGTLHLKKRFRGRVVETER